MGTAACATSPKPADGMLQGAGTRRDGQGWVEMDKQQEFVLRTLEERDIRFVRLWFTDVLGFL